MIGRDLLVHDDTGSGDPLVLVHGLLANRSMFRPLVPLLSPRLRLVAPDLRGHGESRALPPPYTPDRDALDLVALLDHLGIERAHVLGYSHGGATAQQLAHRHPQRVGHLVLVCTYSFNQASLRERVEGWMMPRAVRLLGVERVAKMAARAAPGLDEEQRRWLREMLAGNQRDQALASIRAMRDYDSRGWLNEIHCPTLVVAGSADTAVPLHHAHTLTRGIPGAELHVVAGAGHTLIWTHPGALAEVVLEFLGRS